MRNESGGVSSGSSRSPLPRRAGILRRLRRAGILPASPGRPLPHRQVFFLPASGILAVVGLAESHHQSVVFFRFLQFCRENLYLAMSFVLTLQTNWSCLTTPI